MQWKENHTVLKHGFDECKYAHTHGHPLTRSPYPRTWEIKQKQTLHPTAEKPELGGKKYKNQ